MAGNVNGNIVNWTQWLHIDTRMAPITKVENVFLKVKTWVLRKLKCPMPIEQIF